MSYELTHRNQSRGGERPSVKDSGRRWGRLMLGVLCSRNRGRRVSRLFIFGSFNGETHFSDPRVDTVVHHYLYYYHHRLHPPPLWFFSFRWRKSSQSPWKRTLYCKRNPVQLTSLQIMYLFPLSPYSALSFPIQLLSLHQVHLLRDPFPYSPFLSSTTTP